MNQMEVKRRFDDLKAEIKALELQNPELAVLIFEKPSGVAASSFSRSLRRANLKRVVLWQRSGEIWIEKSSPSWSGSQPWSDAAFRDALFFHEQCPLLVEADC